MCNYYNSGIIKYVYSYIIPYININVYIIGFIIKYINSI